MGLKIMSRKELFPNITIITNKMILMYKIFKMFQSKKKTQELKKHYQTHFIKGSTNKLSCIFCNHYCRLCHILFECEFRNRDNSTKVTWVSKPIEFSSE